MDQFKFHGGRIHSVEFEAKTGRYIGHQPYRDSDGQLQFTLRIEHEKDNYLTRFCIIDHMDDGKEHAIGYTETNEINDPMDMIRLYEYQDLRHIEKEIKRIWMNR